MDRGGPDPGRSLGGVATFIIRLFPDEGGRVTGVLERPRTGEKRQIRSLEAVGRVLEQMLGRGVDEPPRGSAIGKASQPGTRDE